MPAILIYVLGVLTLPFLCLACCLLVDLFHRSAWYCPWCSEWAVKSKDNPNRTAYLPNIIVWFARIGHRLSKRHRKWKRVYETYDFHLQFGENPYPLWFEPSCGVLRPCWGSAYTPYILTLTLWGFRGLLRLRAVSLWIVPLGFFRVDTSSITHLWFSLVLVRKPRHL